jgi:alginate O-acetyltransferase complex protein AlgI
MAMGLGYLFGLRIPINFNSPYKALDPSDFWRRWHISLSSCLRDYLYIPLGGNRGTRALMYRNLMLTMLIGGLWHGAGWTFIIWGAYHGILLSAHRAVGAYWARLPVAVQRGGMFVLVVVGWVFFRAADVPMAADLLRRMFVPTSGMLVPQPWLSVLALVLAGFWAMRGPNVLEMNHAWRPLWMCALAVGFGASLSLIAGDRSSPFLYFQF